MTTALLRPSSTEAGKGKSHRSSDNTRHTSRSASNSQQEIDLQSDWEVGAHHRWAFESISHIEGKLVESLISQRHIMSWKLPRLTSFKVTNS